MEPRARRPGRQLSPERYKVWSEPRKTKVPVVYYLSRNSTLEQPHFIEVPLSSPGGLYLRDVVDRLNEIRGLGMATRYSWSCKRSYKNGFVWHDLTENDLVTPTPANGNEYVLKGSERLGQAPADWLRQHTSIPHLQKETPTSSINQEAHPSSIFAFKLPKLTPTTNTRKDEFLPTSYWLRSSSSPEMGSSSLVEYMVHMASGWRDASTQTEDGGGRKPLTSIDDELLVRKFKSRRQYRNPCFIDGDENCSDEIFPSSTATSVSSIAGRKNTLESLIRADISRMNNLRIFEEEEVSVPMKAKLRLANMLLQLITCGSISLKNYRNIEHVPTYKSRISHVGSPLEC